MATSDGIVTLALITSTLNLKINYTFSCVGSLLCLGFFWGGGGVSATDSEVDWRMGTALEQRTSDGFD